MIQFSRYSRFLELYDSTTPDLPRTSVSSGSGHHRELTKRIIATVKCTDPQLLMRTLLRRSEREWLLARMWEWVCEYRGPAAKAGFALDDLRVHTGWLGAHLLVAIEMPQPLGEGEAYGLAIVFEGVEGDKGFEPTRVRLFALELGYMAAHSPTLVEHTAFGTITHAGRPEASFIGFMRAVSDRVLRSSAPYQPPSAALAYSVLGSTEIAHFARHLRSLYVGDATTGLIVGLRKTAADHWLCSIDAANGGRASSWVPPFEPTALNVERFRAELAAMMAPLTGEGGAGGHIGPPSAVRPPVIDDVFADLC